METMRESPGWRNWYVGSCHETTYTDFPVEPFADLNALWVMGQNLVQTAKFANVVLPGASYVEKGGTFNNGERRVQRVNEGNPASEPSSVVRVKQRKRECSLHWCRKIGADTN